MHTINSLEKVYLRPIPTKIKKSVQKWITTEKAQYLIDKALKSKLSDSEVSQIYLIGNQRKGTMPYLYWLTCIYIHPLTQMEALHRKIEKL